MASTAHSLPGGSACWGDVLELEKPRHRVGILGAIETLANRKASQTKIYDGYLAKKYDGTNRTAHKNTICV